MAQHHILSERTIIWWFRQSLWWWPPHPLFSINLYHQPTSSDLYRTSIGNSPPIPLSSPIIILIITITKKNHMTFTTAHLKPHSLHTCSMLHSYHTTHNTCSRGHESWPPHGIPRIWVSILWQALEYNSFATFPLYYHMLSTITPFMLCQYLYKYSSCSIYFASSNINLATSLPCLVPSVLSFSLA